MSATIVAVDPGSAGGFAIRENGKVRVFGMPGTDGDIYIELREIVERATSEGSKCVAIMEDLVKFCGVGRPGAASIVYGRNHGFIEGVLTGLGVRIERVRAQQWQKDLGLGTSRGMSKTVWKNKLKAMAQRLYPALNGEITLKTADALLILEWSIRKEKA